MCFQIHKNGAAVDGVSYRTLMEASVALEKAAQGGEVTARWTDSTRSYGATLRTNAATRAIFDSRVGCGDWPPS